MKSPFASFPEDGARRIGAAPSVARPPGTAREIATLALPPSTAIIASVRHCRAAFAVEVAGGNADMHCYECSVQPPCVPNMRETAIHVQQLSPLSPSDRNAAHSLSTCSSD